jgi:hypothetical protein
MKTIKKHFLIILSIALFYSLKCQNETNIWYFGDKAGLDFSTEPPTILNNGAMVAEEGCLSISDSVGNLHFYTNGAKFWDRNHTIMTGGNYNYYTCPCSQFGNIVTGYSSNSYYYHIFTITHFSTLDYSVVDMNNNNGLGDVVSYATSAAYFGPTQKIGGYKTKSKTWTVVRGYDSIYVLRDNNPSWQYLPIASKVPFIGSYKGCLKVSPDGKRVAVTHLELNRVELFNFDTLTGHTYNPIVLSYSIDGAYGCEFSPDGSKLYVSSKSDGKIYQWNVCLSLDSAIINSKQIIGYCNSPAGSMQLAKNGKIYIANYNQSYLSVIYDPNRPGFACNFQNAAQSLGNSVSKYGLPNFLSSYFYKPTTLTVTPPGAATICVGEPLVLSVSDANSAIWSNGATTSTITVIPPPWSATYTVTATHTLNSCPHTSVITIDLYDCTKLGEHGNKDISFNLYPTPTKGELILESESKAEMCIYDSSGKIILTWYLEIGKTKKDISELPNGLYLVRRKGDERSKTLHIAK